MIESLGRFCALMVQQWALRAKALVATEPAKRQATCKGLAFNAQTTTFSGD